jgi:hypothetical protein
LENLSIGYGWKKRKTANGNVENTERNTVETAKFFSVAIANFSTNYLFVPLPRNLLKFIILKYSKNLQIHFSKI